MIQQMLVALKKTKAEKDIFIHLVLEVKQSLHSGQLQGRFPIRVDLDSLTEKDFKRILSQTKNAVTLQYSALLEVDNIKLSFTDDALDEIAAVAYQENETSENIGARRLHTVMELLLEDISFNASGNHPMLEVVIDRAYVQNAFKESKRKFVLKKYVL